LICQVGAKLHNYVIDQDGIDDGNTSESGAGTAGESSATSHRQNRPTRSFVTEQEATNRGARRAKIVDFIKKEGILRPERNVLRNGGPEKHTVAHGNLLFEINLDEQSDYEGE
jgi:hypothetical protein